MSERSWLAEVFQGKDVGRGMMGQYIRELEAEVARLTAASEVSQRAQQYLLDEVKHLSAQVMQLRQAAQKEDVDAGI